MNVSLVLLAVASATFVITSTAATFHVSPAGKAGATGSVDAPLPGLAEAAARAQPGDIIRLASGTYKHEQTVRLGTSGTAAAPIRVEPADSKRVLFVFSAQKFEQRLSGIAVAGDYWHIVGLEVTGASRSGILVTGHHNIIEWCRTHDNQNNTAVLTVEQCTATRCGVGFSFTLATASGQPHVFRDNVGWNAPAMFVEGTVLERNLWSSDHRPQIPATIVESTPVTRKPLAPKLSTKIP